MKMAKSSLVHQMCFKNEVLTSFEPEVNLIEKESFPVFTKNITSTNIQMISQTSSNKVTLRAISSDSGVVEEEEDYQLEKSICPHETLSHSKDVSVVLGVYICLEISALSHLNERNIFESYKNCFKTLVESVISNNRKYFEKIPVQLHLKGPLSSQEAVREVAKELFIDSQVNWGRIITLYAFAGMIARHGEEHSLMARKGDYARMIGQCVGMYVKEELSAWISKQGGWEQFFASQRKEESMEARFLKGLFFTIFGVGVYTTWKLMR